MTHCQQFHQQIDALAAQTHLLTTQLEALIQNPTNPQDVKSGSTDAARQKENIEKAFQDQTRVLLTKWLADYGIAHYVGNFIQTISFDDKQRAIINGRLWVGGPAPFPSMIRVITGEVHINGSGIKSADYIEETGDLLIDHAPYLQSMASLRKMHGKFLLREVTMEHLDSVEIVEGTLTTGVTYIPLQSMNGLVSVGNAYLSFMPLLESMASLEEVKGELYLPESEKLSGLPSLQKVGEAILLGNRKQENIAAMFPQLKSVGMNPKDGYSFVVFSDAIKMQILELERKGKLRLYGDIRVTMHL